MADTSIQTESQERTRYFVREPLRLGTLLRRLPVAILLVYYVWILLSAWSMSYSWSWSLDEGLTWSSGGPGSFIPIPSRPGYLAVITRAYLIDQIFYLIFMHGGIWIVWIILGFLYVFSPYRLEKTNVCSLLRGVIVSEVILFLLGAIIITNMHPYWMQVSVLGIGSMLLLTVFVWLIICKR